jgi:RNA polymerase sigma-70 factor (ECF subfamily)
MAKAPQTNPSLLYRLRNVDDRQAWEEFVEIYGPAVYGFGRKKGLQHADAADLTQAVFWRLALHLPRFTYDPQLGRFRAWLFTIVRNELSVLRRPRAPVGTGDSATQRFLEAQPAPEDTEAWDAACDSEVFRWAARAIEGKVQPDSWQAFWRTAVEGRSPAEVASELGMSVAAVYMARSRVMARLREAVRDLESEGDGQEI